jgi:iron(III) transport system permease protein
VTAALGGTQVRRRRVDSEKLVSIGLSAVIAIPLIVFVLVPLWAILNRSFVTPDGFGVANYVRYFTDARFVGIIWNSIAVSTTATAITIVLAYVFAYALHRSMLPFKLGFRLIAMIPLFAPSLVQALGILFLLGRNGLVNRTFNLGLDVYGFWGIVISDVLYSFPHAVLILSAALAVADARLYESARMLGASSPRIFRTVTLPSTKYGLMSATFVVFTIVMTDFGNPQVIGGDFDVLATEIYNQVSGQANFEMGAVVGVILLVPAAIAVAVERWVTRRQYSLVAAQSQPLQVRASRRFDTAMLIYVSLVSVCILAVVGIVFIASFIHLWPWNMSFSLRHYYFDVQNGIQPLWTSIWVSLLAAVIGTVVTVGGAYVIDKFPNPFTRGLYFLSILPAAVPGMVLGLGYILAFNDPANPVYLIYGTIAILAVCNVYHYHAQGFLIATTSVKQISATFDEASKCLGAGLFRTMAKITLPIIWPSIISIAVFFFMRSMVTLSAVIFLTTPKTQLAAVSVLLLDDSGNHSQAAAFSVCIMAVVVVAIVLLHLVLRLFGSRDTEIIR